MWLSLKDGERVAAVGSLADSYTSSLREELVISVPCDHRAWLSNHMYLECTAVSDIIGLVMDFLLKHRRVHYKESICNLLFRIPAIGPLQN